MGPVLMLALVLIALGAALGSFAALAAERVLRREGVIAPRSHCRACGAPIRAWHLIPLISWPLLRGRCAECGAQVPATLWQAEILGALAGLSVAVAAPDPARAVLALGWMTSLIALAMADLSRFRLPDALVAVAAVLGLALALAGDGTGWPDLPTRALNAVIGGAAGAGAFWAVRTGYGLATGREGMGLGDVKLLGALGLALGLERLPITVLIAAVTALCLALMRAARRGRRLDRLGRVPFGAVLCAAAAVVWLAL